MKADSNCLLHMFALSKVSVFKIPFSLSEVIPNASFLRDLTNDQNFFTFSFFLGQSGSGLSVSKENILEIRYPWKYASNMRLLWSFDQIYHWYLIKCLLAGWCICKLYSFKSGLIEVSTQVPVSIGEEVQRNTDGDTPGNLLLLLFFENNGTPSVTEDYLPCAMMLFTMKFG